VCSYPRAPCSYPRAPRSYPRAPCSYPRARDPLHAGISAPPVTDRIPGRQRLGSGACILGGRARALNPSVGRLVRASAADVGDTLAPPNGRHHPPTRPRRPWPWPAPCRLLMWLMKRPVRAQVRAQIAASPRSRRGAPTGHDRARPGTTGPDRARQGTTGHGRARQGTTGPDRARQGMTGRLPDRATHLPPASAVARRRRLQGRPSATGSASRAGRADRRRGGEARGERQGLPRGRQGVPALPAGAVGGHFADAMAAGRSAGPTGRGERGRRGSTLRPAAGRQRRGVARATSSTPRRPRRARARGCSAR